VCGWFVFVTRRVGDCKSCTKLMYQKPTRRQHSLFFLKEHFRRTVIKMNSSHDFMIRHHCLNKRLWSNHSTRPPPVIGPDVIMTSMSVERARRAPGSRCFRDTPP
jgi:hypothetical protein